ncbi:MAG: sel1 repeat family protein [Clostridia bacterium]|nr:sel1 repeat family protein [Clostridia bacterium]
MTIGEAKDIYRKYSSKSVLTDDEEFLLTEAMKYLVEETKDTRWMVELGGYHYEQKNFDLALKYYELADEYGDKWAAEGLGYIWYYGRTGVKDYDKAFKYYTKAMENGQLRSMIKVADMYKNGYGVEKDYSKYCEMIEQAYKKVRYARFLNEPLPEVFTRLARIRTEQGRTEDAIDLYLKARDFLAEKISHNPFFGDLNSMKWLTEDLYKLTDVDYADLDLYDLYYLLTKPCMIAFTYDGQEYIVESVEEGGAVAVKFGDKWFRDVSEFFQKAVIDGERIPVLYYQLSGFKGVITWKS